MTLCRECRNTPWPFAMVAFITCLLAFVTWLVLGFSQDDPWLRIAGTSGVFVAVGATLLHYVVSCMRHHCAQHRHRSATDVLRHDGAEAGGRA